MIKPTFFITQDASSVVDKPDVPTVLWPHGMKPLILCANQCVRDKEHVCGVPVRNHLLLDTRAWVDLVTERIPWMVLTWGQHRHTLPFCCVRCMFEFVNERLVSQGDTPFALMSAQQTSEYELMSAAGKLWLREHGDCPSHGVVSCNHSCSVYDGEVFGPGGYAPQGIERARAYLTDNARG